MHKVCYIIGSIIILAGVVYGFSIGIGELLLLLYIITKFILIGIIFISIGVILENQINMQLTLDEIYRKANENVEMVHCESCNYTYEASRKSCPKCGNQ